MKKMTLEQFKEQFNIKLNNQQLKAVQSVQNPTLLLAVPGSGKTESFSSSYDPLTWNTGCPCLCMCAVVRRWSDLDGDTDRLGDGGCGRNHPVKTRRAY